MTDEAIVRNVMDVEQVDEGDDDETGGDATVPTSSHSTCFETALKWMERQPDCCPPTQLLAVKRDLAAPIQATSLK